MDATLGELLLLALSLCSLVALLVFVVRDTVQGRRQTRRQKSVLSNGRAGDENGEQPVWLDSITWKLRAAGFPANPGVFLILVVIIPTAAALTVMRLMGDTLAPALLVFALSVYVVCGVVRETRRFWAMRYEEKLVDAVDLLVGALKGGEGPMQAMASTAEASERVIRREFDEVVNRLRLGIPIRRSLTRMVDRYDSESVRLFINTLAAKWTAGGDLAPVLLTVSRMMRDRLRHRLRVRAQLAGAWVTSILIAISPYIVMLAFRWLVPEWLNDLLEHPAGPGLLFIAVCLQIVGFTWLHHIMRIEIW